MSPLHAAMQRGQSAAEYGKHARLDSDLSAEFWRLIASCAMESARWKWRRAARNRGDAS